MLSKSAGFSLIELMVVIAIVAILSTVAIPHFLGFQMRARQTEAYSNLGAIRACEEGYRAENDVYLDATQSPAAGALDGTPDPWADNDANGNWTAMGFAPDGEVRYKYSVTLIGGAGGVPPGYRVIARGDVDNNGQGVDIVITNTASVPRKYLQGTNTVTTDEF